MKLLRYWANFINRISVQWTFERRNMRYRINCTSRWRSKDVLESGNVIAIEPKFVIPGVGAVGIENSYVVSEDGLVRLTHAPEEIICL